MTTANKLTVARVLLVPVFLLFLLKSRYGLALAVFILASLTDLADGYIARNYNQISDFGKFMDPLADRILVLSCMVGFCALGRFPAWAVVVVLAREFAVDGLRMMAAAGGTVLAAGWSGKIKTASTMVGLCLMMFINRPFLDHLVVAVVVLTTLYSGVEYFLNNKKVFGL